jgi:uncharacterized membrane protein YgdD (TMEM256/DUF423 family)
MLSTKQPLQRTILLTGGFFAATAVALGALGSHNLKPQMSPDQFYSFDTGVRYQMYHALAIMIVGVLLEFIHSKHRLPFSFISFVLGILFFSGSLYLIATRSLMQIEYPKLFFLITPLGGIFFILGWILFISGVLLKK